jgi:hypothetical protein
VRRLILPVVFVLSLAFVAGLSMAAQVYHHPKPAEKLETRWEWALESANRKGFNDGFWVAYSIQNLMDENTFFASTGRYTYHSSYHSLDLMEGKSLGELVYGKKVAPDLPDEEQVRRVAQKALEKMDKPYKEQRKVWKDVAILFLYRPPSSQPQGIRYNNLSVPFDPNGFPLFWLYKTDDAESVSFLSKLYRSTENEKFQKRLLGAIGLHSKPQLVVPFLEKVLKSRSSDNLRGQAAVELGDQNSERSFELLLEFAHHDRSLHVRKRAVSGLEDLRMPAATDGLIDLARNADHRDIRRRAISALGDKASHKAVEALEDFAFNDSDTQVQKHAVYALEDLPDSEGVPYLIKIANEHPNPSIRKSAIYSLGDSDDSRALEALVQIIRKKN